MFSGRTLGALVVLLFGGNGFASTPDIDIPYEKFTLDNGLRVIVHEDRKAPIVAVSVWYHVGSKDEKPGKTGFAHLFEHLMFNGSENYNDEYFKPFDEVGATAMNGTTWFDRTNYFQNVPTPALEMALWMESDRMGHLLGVITQEKLDEQRGVVQNEKRQGDNQPYGRVRYRTQEGLFPVGHPYRWSTIGSMEDLDAASLDDVKEWFRQYYGAANTVLVLAGDINAAEARPLVEKYFADIDAGPPLKRLKTMVPERETSTHEVMYEQVPQARLYRSWAVPGRTTLEGAHLQLAAAILGSGRNSRLYRELVYQRQIATAVSVDYEAHTLASIFTIDAMVRPGSDPAEVSRVIDQVVAEFLDKGPTRAEIARVRTTINAGLIRGLERIGGFGGKAVTLARSELYGGSPDFWRTRLGWLNSASRRDVLRAANKWLGKGDYRLDVLPFAEHQTVATDADRSKIPYPSVMPALKFPQIERSRLKNGVEVVLAERHAVPIINIAIQFDAGYAADAGRKLGAASFTLAMLREGTTSRDALEISEESELLGARIRTGSSLDMSQASMNALKANLDESMELFADIVRNPSFEIEEIERLRPRSLAAIQQEKVQPVTIALRELPPLLYGKDHAYGIPLTGSGTEESVKSITRDDLLAFHRDWLRPDNATIFVVGDTSMSEMLPLLNQHFGDWDAPASEKPVKNIAEVELATEAKIYLVDKPGSPQSLILAGHLAPPAGADNNLVIGAMNNVIGGDFTARINMDLRETKSWSYGARTFIIGARGQQPYLVYAPVQTDRTADSVTALLAQFDAYLGSDRTRPEELDRVVKNETRSLPGQYETGAAVLRTMLSNARFGRPDDYVLTLTDQYEAMSLEQIDAAADEVLKPHRLIWLIVGDLAKIEEPIRALGIADVEILEL
ncbi:MAG: insulinase family protein [Proteobacteria bacterium]|nr:insulinase family protein [Pseudomonadota bacterium]